MNTGRINVNKRNPRRKMPALPPTCDAPVNRLFLKSKAGRPSTCGNDDIVTGSMTYNKTTKRVRLCRHHMAQALLFAMRSGPLFRVKIRRVDEELVLRDAANVSTRQHNRPAVRARD